MSEVPSVPVFPFSSVTEAVLSRFPSLFIPDSAGRIPERKEAPVLRLGEAEGFRQGTDRQPYRPDVHIPGLIPVTSQRVSPRDHRVTVHERAPISCRILRVIPGEIILERGADQGTSKFAHSPFAGRRLRKTVSGEKRRRCRHAGPSFDRRGEDGARALSRWQGRAGCAGGN